MDDLDYLYSRMLHFGFLHLREAFDSGDDEWLSKELELLHNVPSLLSEENSERHRYFWFKERNRYVAWVLAHGGEESTSRMRSFYEPIWNEMEPLILRRLEPSNSIEQD